MFNTMHLFRGVAGGLFADLILGHRPVCYVELNPDACRIVRGMVAAGWFPGLDVVEQSVADQHILGGASVVAGFDPANWKGRVDCLHAGFPCQDISVAGKGAGIHGKRSGLYREAIRCIEVIKPAYVFFENVPAIVSRGRHVVIGDLVALGYTWRDGILSASDVGAPHIRKRWWCLARRADVADPDRDQRQSGHQEQSGGGRLRGSHCCPWLRSPGRPHAPGIGGAVANRHQWPEVMRRTCQKRLVGC
jgi:DNA (cytosine-5)-methyltransferase 1